MLKKPEILKKVYFIIFDLVFCFFKLNKKNNDLTTKKMVIWLAETGSRDFIPRFAQAISLWNEYKIPSLLIHKHYLRKLGKRILSNSIVIDKSATISCIRRLRYSKLKGSFNMVIPEELLICDRSERLIKGSLHPSTLKYVDAVVSDSNEIKQHLKIANKSVKTFPLLNPRLSLDLIEKNCKLIEIPINKNKNSSKLKYILINDKLSLKFSSYDDEIDLIKNNIFKSTDVNAKKYVDNFIRQEEIEEKLLIALIKNIRKEKIFDGLKIIIRPHPAVNLKKYKSYFKSKLNSTLNYSIIRKGTVVEWMQSATLIFHSNCTSAIEGYFKGIKNIYNFSSEYREGTSAQFMEILNPLGIEASILKAKENYSKKQHISQENNSNFKSHNKKSVYEFLGLSMGSRDLKFNFEDFLDDQFKYEKITEFSASDRWKDAEERINFLKKNKFKDFEIKTLGSIGVQIGMGKN